MAILTDSKGKSVEVFFLDEHEELSMNVSTHPIEVGAPITDHSQIDSETFSHSGWLQGNSQSEIDAKYQQLREWSLNGELINQSGAIRRTGLMITNLSKDYGNGGYRNTIQFSIDLTSVFTAKVTWYKNVNAGKKQSSPSGAVYITVVAGNTYWGWWQKYGTSINQLRAWNGWPDRAIPIGARARVK